VDYTDPFMDQSLEISASEQANVSYPEQTAGFCTRGNTQMGVT